MPIDQEQLREFVRGLAPPGTDIEANTPLISTGLIDSFAMLSLIAHVEQAGGFKLRATEVNLSNLDSIDRILRLAQSKSTTSERSDA